MRKMTKKVKELSGLNQKELGRIVLTASIEA